MVFILDGCSFHFAHIWSKLGISICLRHLVSSKESSNPFFSRERPILLLCAQGANILYKYHMVSVYYRYTESYRWFVRTRKLQIQDGTVRVWMVYTLVPQSGNITVGYSHTFFIFERKYCYRIFLNFFFPSSSLACYTRYGQCFSFLLREKLHFGSLCP